MTFKPSTWIPVLQKDLHWSGMQTTNHSVQLGMKEYLAKAEEYLCFELAEELQAGDYDDKPLLWKAMVHRRALDLIQNHRELQEHVTMKVIEQIEAQALYHYAGCETTEEMLTQEASGKKGGWLNNLINLNRIFEHAKSIGTKFSEPADNTGEVFVQVSPEEYLRRRENRDGSSRLNRLKKTIPTFRKLFGFVEKYSLVPQLESEAATELAPKVEAEKLGEAVREQVTKEQASLATGVFQAAADHRLTLAEFDNKIDIGQTKVMFQADRPNGHTKWLVVGTLTDDQFVKFKDRNYYSAIIQTGDDHLVSKILNSTSIEIPSSSLTDGV